MTLRHALLLAALLVVAAVPAGVRAAPASSPADERTQAAYLLAFGRLPSADEAASAAAGSARPLAAVVEELRGRLRDDAALRRDTLERSVRDAFGRAATAAESAAPDASYAGLMQLHLRRLADDPAEHAATIERAYRRALRRAAHAEEIAYWRARPPVPFALLVACIENWATRDSPGLTSTSGTPSASINSAFLVAVRLTPPVAREVRAIAGLPGADEATSGPLAVRGRTVVTPGAGEIVSVGGIHFIAVGRSDLVGAAAN